MELGLPELMTQNDWTAIVPFVVQNKRTAEHRSHAQHTKEICGHILHLNHRRRFVSWRGELPSCAVGIGRDRIQRVGLAPPVEKVGERDVFNRSGACILRCSFPLGKHLCLQRNQSFRIRKWLGSQQYSAYHAEYRSCRSDTQSQCEHNDQAKPEIRFQLPKCEGKIPTHPKSS